MKSTRYLGLDLMRGLAAFSVFTGHLLSRLLPGSRFQPANTATITG